jgi:hypothetical protein
MLSLVGLVYSSSPPPAVAGTPGRAACEGYCWAVAGGCYGLASFFVGKDKCDTMYKGCVDGCIAALLDEE